MENLSGTDYILEIDTTTAVATNDRGTDANYRLIACLTSNGIEIGIADQDTSNKCDGGYATSVGGQGTWSFPAEGQAVSLTEAEEDTSANYEELIGLAVEKTIFFARMIKPGATAPYREGKVRISAYSETAPNQAPYTFTATFTGIGKPFLAPPAP